MSVSCFVCGGQARYLPSGPAPGAKIVNAPEAEDRASSGDWQEIARSGVAPAVPSPTVPVQTPEALLELDAEEAPTVPVQSLKEEDFLRLGLLPEDLDAGPGADPGSIDEDVIPTRAVSGLADREITLLGEEPGGEPEDLEEVIPTRAVAGLAGRPVVLLGDDPLVDEPDEDVIPTRAVAGLADRQVIQYKEALGAPEPSVGAEPDIEEEIPTRSVSGLADKQIASYAPGLYDGDAPPGLGAEPASWDGGVPSAEQSSWDGNALSPGRSSWDEGDLAAPADASWDASANPPVASAKRSSWESEVKPSSSSGPGLALEHNPTMVGEPGLGTSSFAAAGPASGDAVGDISPSLQERKSTSGPAVGVGAHPSLFNVEGLDVRPSGSASQSNTAMRLLAGILFVVVFCVIFVGLIAYKQPDLFDKLLDREPASAAKPDEEAEPPKEDQDETPRHEAFGLSPLDEDAPVEVKVTNIQLRVKGDEVTVRIEGELTWNGEAALSSAELGGVVALQLPDEVRETYPLGAGTLKPSVARGKAWKPGDARTFTITSKAIPKASIDHKGREVLFAWISLKGKGKKLSYDAPIHNVDIKD